MSDFGISLEGVKDKGEYEVLPAGEYACEICSSERKDTKSGDAQYLQVGLKVKQGEYENRVVFDNFNLWTAQGSKWVQRTDQAGTIAAESLKDLLSALGMGIPDNHTKLIGKKVVAKLGIRKGTGDYGDQNSVKKYSPAASFKAATKEPERVKPTPRPAADLDDEIPF
jgi:hypothetical protein